MNVKLTNDDVLEACREWLERHYSIEAPAQPEIRVTLVGSNTTVYVVEKLAIDFADVPKPGGSYRG